MLSYNATDTVVPVNVTDTDHEERTIPPRNDSPKVLKAVVYAREFIISNLGHFEDYTVEVC